jgi:hypothetical protein
MGFNNSNSARKYEWRSIYICLSVAYLRLRNILNMLDALGAREVVGRFVKVLSPAPSNN